MALDPSASCDRPPKAGHLFGVTFQLKKDPAPRSSGLSPEKAPSATRPQDEKDHQDPIKALSKTQEGEHMPPASTYNLSRFKDTFENEFNYLNGFLRNVHR